MSDDDLSIRDLARDLTATRRDLSDALREKAELETTLAEMTEVAQSETHLANECLRALIRIRDHQPYWDEILGMQRRDDDGIHEIVRTTLERFSERAKVVAMAEWAIFRNSTHGYVTIALSPVEMIRRGVQDNVSRPAEIESREEYERFRAELDEVADEVWPRE